LKATWVFTALVPSDWVVVSNTSQDEGFAKDDQSTV
jgi:hypothetical protein